TNRNRNRRELAQNGPHKIRIHFVRAHRLLQDAIGQRREHGGKHRQRAASKNQGSADQLVTNVSTVFRTSPDVVERYFHGYEDTVSGEQQKQDRNELHGAGVIRDPFDGTADVAREIVLYG